MSGRNQSQLPTKLAKLSRVYRFLNLGCPERGLVTRDPDSGDALPVDDVAWDTGVSHCCTSGSSSTPLLTYRQDEAPEVHTLSCDAEIYSGRFARLAQTANLLAQVLRHAREHGTEARHGSRETEATQLDRTLRALINLMDLEGTLRSTPPCAQRSICFRYVRQQLTVFSVHRNIHLFTY